MSDSDTTTFERDISREELITRARAMIPKLRENQERTEADRRVSDEIFQELLDAELFRVLLPRRYGGLEYGLDTFVDVAYEIARGCGATGWVHSITSKYHLFLGMFPAEAQDDVWGADRRAVTAASFTPTGTVTAVDGGWKLSGRWMYCSGIDNCPWMIVGANVATDDGSEPTDKGYALAPTADFGIEDNWQVIGLAGTGSKNAYCEDMFIPAHRFLALEDTMSGRPPGIEVNPGDIYRLPLFAAISASLCAPIMGMARGAHDEFMEATRARVTRGAALSKPAPMAEIPTIQLRLGEASASIDAARLLVDRDCKEIMATLATGDALTQEQRARNKGDLGFATQLSLRAVDRLFEASGGGALFAEGRIQRFWRDIHAGAMHISMNWDAVGALYGRVSLGLPPGPAQF
jgi:alkylation response protein AidB-like acyl-CoA dehydrogenase